MKASGIDDQHVQLPEDQLRELKGIVGSDHVFTGIAERIAYARDRAPVATFSVRSGQTPGTLPGAVVQPGSEAELQDIVGYARAQKLAVIPFGAGSGVLGGTVPLNGEIVIDLKRLNRIREIAEEDGLVTVEAGKNGARFEAELREVGFTTGHLPQSLHMSTVGGWVACRGAGQASTLYGKIEDMVAGVRGVLPSGEVMRVQAVPRRATGPSLKDVFVGSEGAFGVITEITLRIWRIPEVERGVVLAFPDVARALRAMRRILQDGLRPAVVRVYDARESASRTEGLPEFQQRPVLAMMEFHGPNAVVDAVAAHAMDIVESEGGVETDGGPHAAWQQHRYVSYSPNWQAKGYYMDTIEVSAPWSRLLSMYDAMQTRVLEIDPDAHFGAHWSHVYPDGACQYMTVRLPQMDETDGRSKHRQIWDAIQTLAVELGGSISHHHGVGAFRDPWMGAELDGGLSVLQGIKNAIDPENLFNPGKLGLRGHPDAVKLGRRESSS